MKIEAILFDVNGTMIDILTNEGMPDLYRKMRDFLHYQGIYLDKWVIRDLYYQIMKEQREASLEKFPEFDAVSIWKKILDLNQTTHTKNLMKETQHSLPILLAQLYRAASLCKKLTLYDGVKETLDCLKGHYKLGIVTDGQSAYAIHELRSTGIEEFFDPIVVSGDYGYRKPDPRLYQKALNHLNVSPENTVFVGNDMYRDVYGAHQLGMKTIFFSTNQGDREYSGANPDYIIYRFPELLNALEFLRAN